MKEGFEAYQVSLPPLGMLWKSAKVLAASAFNVILQNLNFGKIVEINQRLKNGLGWIKLYFYEWSLHIVYSLRVYNGSYED